MKVIDLNRSKAALNRLNALAKRKPELFNRSMHEWIETLKGVEIMEVKETYSIKEVAEILSVHTDTVRKRIRDGSLKSIKLGKDYRISRIELQRFYELQGGGKLFNDSMQA